MHTFPLFIGVGVGRILPCHKTEGIDNAMLFVKLVHSYDSFLLLLSFA
jgi:hypothetical protein